MKNERIFHILIAVLLLVIAATSFFAVGSKMTNPDTYAGINASLEQTEKDVLKLTGTTAAISAAITVLPDDLATPIAEKVADLGGYMLIVLCAVYAERYLLTITGFAAWKILFPIACVLFAINLFKPAPAIRQLGTKLAVLGLAIILVIPCSIKTAELVKTTYADSINETIESAEQAGSQITNLTEVKDEVVNIVNRFMRVAAMYIVVTCVFPILVLVFFLNILNAILGTQFRFAPPKRHLMQS